MRRKLVSDEEIILIFINVCYGKPWMSVYSIIICLIVILISYTVKKIRRCYGKIPGIWLPVLLPLFLRAFTCRTFLEIKVW